MEPKITLMKHSQKSLSGGIALVIVLSFLVLISVIILAFFSSVSTELSNSKAVANSASTHQLADSAVNVVMAQIVDATKGKDSSSATLAWASQPGMIRTFDTSGVPKDFFKLYSSNQMTVDGTAFKADDEMPPTDWSKADNAGLYTDLNQPALVADPAGLIQPDSARPDKYSAVYPIVDPFAEGIIDGFKLSSRPGYADPNLPAPSYNPPQPTSQDLTANPAPMPVKWLYVLRDGTLKPGSNPSAGNVDVTGATVDNPIVGRMAFWADDETAKVNINTASEGSYWDVPRIYSKEDFGEYVTDTHGFSMCQPVQHEYQRYPGHPATTCLSPIFGQLLPVTFPSSTNPTLKDSDKLDFYYNIAPRIGLSAKSGVAQGGGGSLGGFHKSGSTDATMVTDSDRLYASIDELMFTPTLTTAGTPPSRVPNTAVNSKDPKTITKGVLEKAKFFITANSSAPETTLNNTPRVAVWPVAPTAANRTAYDSLLAFCSTIGTKAGSSEYYFTRSPSTSATTGARSGTADFTTRNEQLYRYLQGLTKTNVPGFGGSFLQKYGAGTTPGVTDCDQILTCIYDYIRCTNLQDRSLLASGSPAVSYTPLWSSNPNLGAGEVIPIQIPVTAGSTAITQGFGRFYSINSANLIFYGTHTSKSGSPADKMRAVFLLGFTTPGQGLACMRSNVKYKVRSGLDGLQVNGKSLNFKALGGTNGTNYMDTSDLSLFHCRSVGGTESPSQAIVGKQLSDGPPSEAGGDAHDKYPFFSSSDVDTGDPAQGFKLHSTAEIVVEIRTADTGPGTPGTLIQTLHFNFPDGTFRVPGVVGGNTTATFATRGMNGNWPSLVNVLDTCVALQVGGAKTDDNAMNPSNTNDDFTAGDIRMTAALADVPANRFRADKNYNAGTAKGVQFAHSLLQSIGVPYTGSTYGKLANVPNPSFNGIVFGDINP